MSLWDRCKLVLLALGAVVGVVALTALALMIVLVTCEPDAHAATRGTFAYDYRNAPALAPLEGFETVVLAARATTPARVDSVHAWGGTVLALVQPTLAAWNR